MIAQREAISVPEAVAKKRDELKAVDDVALGDFVAAVQDEKATMLALLTDFQKAGEDEITARLRDREAKEFLHPAFESAALVEKYGEYDYDLAGLKAARTFLEAQGKEEEAVKIVKRVPQQYVAVSTIGRLIDDLKKIVSDGASLETPVLARERGGLLVGQYFKHGAAVSITAIIDRYGPTSEIGKLLLAARKRESQGERLVLKRKIAVKNVTPPENGA